MPRPPYPRPNRYLFFVILILTSLTSARATLRFAETELTLKPVAGQSEVKAEFAFTNTGDTPITITEVRSSCGCTTPAPPKEAVAPGASGVIPVAYQPGERQGRQVQSLQVLTAHGTAHELRLVVEIPVRVTFTPRVVIFERGDRAPKAAMLRFGDDLPVTFVDAISDNPAFVLARRPRVEGEELPVQLHYVGEAAVVARGVVRIVTRGKSGKESHDILYVRHNP